MTEAVVSPQELLLHAGDEMAMSIMASLDDARSRKREVWDHSENNYCSEIHHPCAKHLVHCRVDWEEQKLPDIHSLYRFEEGNDQEWLIKEKLARVGFEIDESQKRVKIPEYKLSGKIDGMISPLPEDEEEEEKEEEETKEELENESTRTLESLPTFEDFKAFPVEIKTLNPHFWESTKTIKDLMEHPKFWINKMTSQINIYMYGLKAPMGFLILKTFGKRWRILPMLFNQDLLDADFAKARKVNEHVDAGTMPHPIPYDPSVCGLCKFEHLCQPLGATMMSELKESDEAELIPFCDLQDQFKQIKKQYEDWKKELIGNEETPGRFFGKDGMVGSIEIKTGVQNRKRIQEGKENVVKALLEPHQEPYELRMTKILRINP